MSAYAVAGWIWLVIVILAIVRCELAYRMSMKALGIDMNAYERGPSFTWMELQIWKWTFRQFYPELAAKVKS
jgi:hypothetical protein